MTDSPYRCHCRGPCDEDVDGVGNRWNYRGRCCRRGPAAFLPATDGERIVVYFGSCGLLCYDLTGKEQWKVEMAPAVIAGNFGSGTSPILADGLVVLVRDEVTDPRILAFDAVTGSPRWEKKRQSAVSYSTPVDWATPDGKQIVAAGHGRMVGYDLKTGAEKWFMPGMPSGPCAS